MKALAWTGLAALSTGLGIWLLRDGLARRLEVESARYMRRRR